LALAACSPAGPSDPNPVPIPVPIPSTPTPAPSGTADPTAPVSLAGRAAHTATAIAADTVLIAGGCVVDGCAEATASAYLLDRAGSRPTASLTQARDAHTAVRLRDGSVLVTGGFAGEGRPPLAGGETYDPATRRWAATGPLAVGRGGHAAAVLGSGQVLVAGGWVGSRRYTDTTELYDPDRRVFTAGPRLASAVDGLTATSLDDGSVLVVGGQTRPGVATGRALLVSRDGERLTATGALRTARFKHAAVTLPSGEVLVLGGTSDDENLLSSTEIYDPGTRRFRPGPAMSSSRYKLAGGAVVLPDGRVAAAGSGPGLEIIDPTAFTSRPATGGPRTPSSFATTSVVGDTVRVIGGYDRSIRLSRTDLSLALRDLR
jgi:hypothetical protein